MRVRAVNPGAASQMKPSCRPHQQRCPQNSRGSARVLRSTRSPAPQPLAVGTVPIACCVLGVARTRQPAGGSPGGRRVEGGTPGPSGDSPHPAEPHAPMEPTGTGTGPGTAGLSLVEPLVERLKAARSGVLRSETQPVRADELLPGESDSRNSAASSSRSSRASGVLLGALLGALPGGRE